ncbi:hypothetical protein EV175_005266 [Coemansia sp. RSA 1933]|nr:hypothetical protein EV175_005266 [Coemansia sp. RSA 1933]
MFVSQRIKTAMGNRRRAGEESPADANILLPNGKWDIKPLGADDDHIIDGALAPYELSSPVRPKGRPDYSKTAMIIEVKRHRREHIGAYAQAIAYARQLYATQINRNYTWALTMCGTEVRVLLLHHDGIRSSPVIDISEVNGIRRLVTVLVHWSFCSPERLGYDPSITWNEETRNWEILCANGNDPYNPTPYVITRTLYHASALFGRHTRCFLVRRKDGGNNNRETVLKSSWSLPIDMRKGKSVPTVISNEMDILGRISRVLGSRNQNYIFPRVVSGGEVRLLKGDEYVADDTTQIYEYDEGDMRQAFRVYQHLNMSPVGNPLNSVENEEELVLVLADVMEFHNAIFEQCNVLHRDISVNNILVVRDFEGQSASQPVRGLLIDYDHAVRTDQRSRSYSRRSGSLPFMSIHNLEAHESERTPLDDWESLLYVICWLATLGINQADRESIGSGHGAKILKWRKGYMRGIADKKRMQMDNLGNFRLTILAGFQGKYRLLKPLAAGIYNALFQHQGCEGANIQTDGIGETFESVVNLAVGGSLPSDQPFAEQPGRDPLVRRKENEDDIIRTLLTTIQTASTVAQQILAHRSANVGTTSAPAQ